MMTESPAVSQERMKRELAAFLQEVSTDNPLVLFFDDLHWADTSTVDIIAYIATKLTDDAPAGHRHVSFDPRCS